MKVKQIIIPVLLVVLLVPGVYIVFRKLGAKPNGTGMQMPPPVVTVAKPRVQTVTSDFEFTGTLSAVEEVEVRARVKGYLNKICFEEGKDVSKDELLFEIEPELHQAQKDQAQANLKSRESELVRAESDLQRVLEAVKTNAVSQQQVTTSIAARDQAQAAVLAAKASLAEATLNLSYTRITSPINGRISIHYVDKGNLVGAGENTLLANVVKLDPIYVTFYISEGFLFDGLNGTNEKNLEKMKFYVGLKQERGFPREGFLNYIDNKVDPDTGTVLVRGQLANPDKRLLPGMFVRINVPLGTLPNAILVDEWALGTDIGGKYLLVVNSDNIVQHRPVQVGRQLDSLRVISSGLSADETYVVKGLQFVYPGMKVNPHFENGQPQPADAQPKPGGKGA